MTAMNVFRSRQSGAPSENKSYSVRDALEQALHEVAAEPDLDKAN